MSHHAVQLQQNDNTLQQNHNTSKLVMNTFYKMANKEGVTPTDVANYLREKFGDVWRLNVLTGKAEETLKKSAALGFLERHGDRYLAILTREMCCGRRRRRRRRSCRRRRRSCRRRRRSCRRRRKKRCCCN